MEQDHSSPPSLLAIAIERREWELAALCLLYGVVKAAEALPPDAVEALLEMLAVDEPAQRRHGQGARGRRCDRRR